MGHDDDQRHLTHVGGFAAHVGTGDDQHAARIVQFHVVGDEGCFQGLFHQSFFLPTKNNVRLTLFDILGKEVKVITEGNLNYGKHNIVLNASDLAAGVYFYKLEAGEFVDVKKLVLLK